MTSRITFLLIALFWLTMTYLLWRSEYVGQNMVGSSVPVELVWRKILTASDSSQLIVTHNGGKVGECKWDLNIGQDKAAEKILTDDAPVEGMVEGVSVYRLEFSGRLTFSEAPGSVRFAMEVKLATNRVWQEFNLKLAVQHMAYIIYSRASEQTVRLEIEDKNKKEKSEQVFTFAELQNPQALLEEFGLPGAMGMLGGLGLPPTTKLDASLLPEVKWTARNDWIAIGHTSVRAYRLEASLLDRYRMLIIVSSVGEILRVQLPDGWELTNNTLVAL